MKGHGPQTKQQKHVCSKSCIISMMHTFPIHFISLWSVQDSVQLPEPYRLFPLLILFAAVLKCWCIWHQFYINVEFQGVILLMNGDRHNKDDVSSSIKRERTSIYQSARLPPCISEFSSVLCATAELTSLQLGWDLNINKSDKASQDPVLHIKDYTHSPSWY